MPEGRSRGGVFHLTRLHVTKSVSPVPTNEIMLGIGDAHNHR